MNPSDEYVRAVGELFAVLLDKRDGLATQEDVDVAKEKLIAAYKANPTP